MKICTAENCEKPSRAYGFCHIHRADRDKINARNQDRYHKNPEYQRASTRAWKKENLDKVREYRQNNIEYQTVYAHWELIYKPRLGHKYYKDMPFFNEWNPKQGGSFTAGANWIIENLGRRPDKKYQLHVVDRRLGFVPGNLRWVPQEKHRQEEMIAKLLLENQQLKDIIKRAGIGQ
jgi:hypothetical protein